MSKDKQLTANEIYRKGLEDGYMRALDYVIANLQRVKDKRKGSQEKRTD